MSSFRIDTDIVYVWSQYDGANIEQWYGWRQNQEAKLKIVGSWPTIKKLIQPTANNICNCIITFSIGRDR